MPLNDHARSSNNRLIHDLIISLRGIMREMERAYSRYQQVDPEATELFMQMAHAYRVYYLEEAMMRERLAMPMIRREPEWVIQWLQQRTATSA